LSLEMPLPQQQTMTFSNIYHKPVLIYLDLKKDRQIVIKLIRLSTTGPFML